MSARILIVDDLMPNVKLLSVKLTREYFEVITAFNGVEALEKIKNEHPDIILLDIMMPGMDGFEVCTRIKADPETAHIPVVMVTALSDAADRVRGLECGADDFLTKPVDDVALFARVRSLVRLKLTVDQWRLREGASSQIATLNNIASSKEEMYTEASVVLVDDTPLEIQKFSNALAQDRHRMTTVSEAQELFDLLDRESVDLIIISLTLNKEDGLRLCSQLRSKETTRQLPILLISEEFDMSRTAKGLELGANDYILRPIDKNELLARVRSQIRRKRFQDRLVSNYKANLSMALTDSLTGLFNRRYLMAHLKKTADSAMETHKTYAVLIMDIDHFKHINDTYGHDIGDEVLKEIASRFKAKMRDTDMVARFGGEEFIAVLTGTDLKLASIIAERIREAVANFPFDFGLPEGALNITTSVGLTLCREDFLGSETSEEIIKRADNALYKAKREGRNRVCIELYDTGIDGQSGGAGVSSGKPAAQDAILKPLSSVPTNNLNAIDTGDLTGASQSPLIKASSFGSLSPNNSS